MGSCGYEGRWRPARLGSGLGTAVGARGGGHAINRAAISAALAASPDADPDPKRRWVAGVSTGASYLVLGAASAAFAALVLLAPAAVIPAVAGLALFAAFGSAVQQAIDDPGERLELPATGAGYSHEIVEVNECLRAGRTESAVMPLDDTLAVQGVLAEAADQLGLSFSEVAVAV